MRKLKLMALAKLVKMSLNTTNQYLWAKALKVVGYLFNERAKARSNSLSIISRVIRDHLPPLQPEKNTVKPIC